MTIISNRHLDTYRPGDVIPDDYFSPESLAYALAKGRVQVVADEPTKPPPPPTPTKTRRTKKATSK